MTALQCWFLSHTHVNRHTWSRPLAPPSCLPPPPALLGCHRASGLSSLSHMANPRLSQLCRLKQDAQLESYEFKFYLGQMRTAAWETASQRALRDGSRAAVGEGQHVRFWWRGSSTPWSTHFTKGFLFVMRIWGHHEGILCFSRSEEMQGLRS